jgi:acyl-CoA hydrolase
MIIEERKQLSKSRQFKIVFKDSINDNNILFGGIAMKRMDEVAYITVTRFYRKRMVTISTDKINFKKSIPYGSIVEIIGRVVDVGNVRLKINVQIFVEEKYLDNSIEAINGDFYFAAVDENGKAIRLK